MTGMPRDNIYAFGVDASASSTSAGSHGAPQDQYDSVILPTADLGPQPGLIPPPGAVPVDQARRRMLIAVVVLAHVAVFIAAFLYLRKRKPPTQPPVPA